MPEESLIRLESLLVVRSQCVARHGNELARNRFAPLNSEQQVSRPGCLIPQDQMAHIFPLLSFQDRARYYQRDTIILSTTRQKKMSFVEMQKFALSAASGGKSAS
jgi:hypothetical protein